MFVIQNDKAVRKGWGGGGGAKEDEKEELSWGELYVSVCVVVGIFENT